MMTTILLTVTLLSQAPPQAQPPSATAQAQYQRQLDRRKAKARARAEAGYLRQRQEAAAATYYREHILPQEHKRAVDAAHAQASLRSAAALQQMGAAAVFRAQTDRERLNLQRQAAGYPLPGVNPYTGAPLGTGVRQPRTALPSDFVP